MRFTVNLKLATWHVIILLAGLCLPVAGQATRGSLSGQILDTTGGGAGAKVIVKNDATGEEFRQAADPQGAFAFLSLPIGRYSGAVEAQGFKRSELREIIIEVATPAKVNVALEVGSVSETVSVSGEAQEVINTTSPTLSAVVTTRQVNDPPLPTRNPLDLVRLQAGIAVADNNIRGANPVGLRESTVALTQDGVNVKDNFLTAKASSPSAPRALRRRANLMCPQALMAPMWDAVSRKCASSLNRARTTRTARSRGSTATTT